MSPAFIKLVRVLMLSILSPGPDYYPFASGSGFYQSSPGHDCIHFESVSYQGSPGCESGSRFYSFLSPGPDFINRVRIRV